MAQLTPGPRTLTIIMADGLSVTAGTTMCSEVTVLLFLLLFFFNTVFFNSMKKCKLEEF